MDDGFDWIGRVPVRGATVYMMLMFPKKSRSSVDVDVEYSKCIAAMGKKKLMKIKKTR